MPKSSGSYNVHAATLSLQQRHVLKSSEVECIVLPLGRDELDFVVKVRCEQMIMCGFLCLFGTSSKRECCVVVSCTTPNSHPTYLCSPKSLPTEKRACFRDFRRCCSHVNCFTAVHTNTYSRHSHTHSTLFLLDVSLLASPLLIQLGAGG